MAPELFRYAARKIGPHEADDRVSDAFLVIWRRWDAAPSDHGERRAWVYGILKQTLRDHASTTVHRESRLARVAAWRRPVAEPLDRAVVDDAWINELLDALPVAQADAVRLAVLGGLTAREVAAQLGTTITSITTRIARARVALRAMIVSREEEE